MPTADNAAGRAVRALGLGRKTWLFQGSDPGGETPADVATLIETAMGG